MWSTTPKPIGSQLTTWTTDYSDDRTQHCLIGNFTHQLPPAKRCQSPCLNRGPIPIVKLQSMKWFWVNLLIFHFIHLQRLNNKSLAIRTVVSVRCRENCTVLHFHLIDIGSNLIDHCADFIDLQTKNASVVIKTKNGLTCAHILVFPLVIAKTLFTWGN